MKNHPMTKALLELYEYLDLHATKAAEEKKATCSKGCYHCCHMMNVITVPEGMLVAEYLLTRLDWKWWARTLRASAKKTMPFKADRHAFWKAELYCPFLDQRSGECMIYDLRPSNCRYYYTVSDPKECKVIEDNKVLTINLYELHARVWKYSLEAVGQRLVAPLDLMILHCMHMAGTQIQQAVTKLLIRGIPDPVTWLREAQDDIDDQLQKTVSDQEMAIAQACMKVGLQPANQTGKDEKHVHELLGKAQRGNIGAVQDALRSLEAHLGRPLAPVGQHEPSDGAAPGGHPGDSERGDDK